MSRWKRAAKAAQAVWGSRWGKILLAAAALVLLVAAAEWASWPDVESLRRTPPASTAFIDLYRQQRRQAGESDEVAWQWVPYQRISPHLKRAVLAAEDINFFGHHGFAREEIKAALKEAWEEWEFPRGASTLTQQLARNLWLSPSRNPLRKLREAILTRQLEKHLEKKRIFEIYLNVVEFGPGLYGAEAAARHYFKIPASQLDPRQAAQLAAGLPRPKSWNPSSQSRAYARRVEVVLERMRQAQWLWDVI
ncbi:MAG TPA: monofunctional biosynthetic peptidoglycan transglycosylase [Acidobacteriota bacterium]|nr:monofunctional biosynthetic peptidoglycan transglycosylase [Acidobacteriota bacterium]